jgi:hypothetical protein
VACFPATPDTAVDLLRQRGDAVPVWFDLQMLDLLQRLQSLCPETSEQGFSTAVCQVLVGYSGCPSAIAPRRLQQLLGEVYEEYITFQHTLADAVELGCLDYPLAKVCAESARAGLTCELSCANNAYYCLPEHSKFSV